MKVDFATQPISYNSFLYFGLSLVLHFLKGQYHQDGLVLISGAHFWVKVAWIYLTLTSKPTDCADYIAENRFRCEI